MKTDPTGAIVLEAPKDFLGFSFEGVTFKRTTKLHQVGRYDVVDQDGIRWVVTGNGSNKYPWVSQLADEDEGPARQHHSKNLIDCARYIRGFRARYPRSPYKG